MERETTEDKLSARVLVVDDEAAISRSLARVLGMAGHAVTTASSGEEAIAALAAQPFDVILSDIRMPGMSGLSLLRAVRARDADIPVAFMTGDPALETAVDALEQGAFRYLLKPVEIDEVIAVVERAARLHLLARLRREASETMAAEQRTARADLEARYAAGVERLWVAMQPLISWRGRSVYAFEALLRLDELSDAPTPWTSSWPRSASATRRRSSPPIRRRIADGTAPPCRSGAKVFVNLHPSDLVDEELAAADGALTPFASRVVLEVTERAKLDEIRGLPEAVARLRALGFRIALDDLGAGYAGLSSFALLEPEIVKVDMSLVRGIHASPMKQKLFQSFTKLCRELDVEIIAEGVEGGRGATCRLDRLGCDLYQGYLFAKPGRGFPEPLY